MKDIYFLLPIFVWLIVQSIKSLVDVFVYKKKITLKWIFASYWRFPSWHSAFMSSLITLVYLLQWFSLLLLVVIVISTLFWFDAVNVRHQVGELWKFINEKYKLPKNKKFRTKVWHTYFEVISGIIIWIVITLVFYKIVW